MDLSALTRAALDTARDRRAEVLGCDVTPDEIRAHLARYDLAGPVPVDDVVADVEAMLERWTEHATHPLHLGLFRPAPDPLCVVADALAAAHDPNLATWDFAPAANEIERFTLERLAGCFGWPAGEGLHHFTSGGQEANHTAVIVALTARFPALADGGLRALAAQPTFYLSRDGHGSFDKVAHATGLGRAAARRVPTDGRLRIDVAALRRQIAADRAAGLAPFMIVGTAGTTGSGAIDDLAALADVARAEELWFHVDAAWGGAAAISPRLRPLLDGVERADSITCDAHKWLSVTAGAGMVFVRHRAPVERAFGVETAYVPARAAGRVYPFVTSLQWSRRAIGLKVFMVLAAHGLAGIARRLEHQVAVGDHLRARLAAAGFAVLNDTPLPLVCFTHPRLAGDAAAHDAVARALRLGQTAWLSRVILGGSTPALRACITGYETQPADIDALVAALASL